MKKMLTVLTIVLCLFMSWNTVGAAVIGFQSLDSGGGSMIALYQEGGYSVTNDFDTFYGIPGDSPLTLPYVFGWWSTGYSGGYAESLALFNNYQALTTTLTKDDNTPFDMISIDLSRLTLDWGGAGSVIFTGIKSDNSTVTQEFTYSDALAFQTKFFSSDFGNLKSLSWITADPWVQEIQFDNITMVPEPTTMLLLGLGLIGLAGARRKFKH
jgi:hypothetical protein